jgi:hypothetical protein
MLISTCVYAQHYVGIKASQGYNSVSALPDFDKRNLKTFSPGILYRYEHKKYLAIQVELNYLNKGYIKEVDTILMLPEITHRITSIELPLMAQGFIKFGPFRPYLTGGVIAGYILDRTQETEGQTEKYPFDEYDRKFEYGLAGGGGLGVHIYKFEIQAECRYHYNFSFLRNPVIPTNRGNRYINTTQLMFSVSLLYRLSK